MILIILTNIIQRQILRLWYQRGDFTAYMNVYISIAAMLQKPLTIDDMVDALVENMNVWTNMLCLVKIEWSLILTSDALCHNKKTVIQTLYIIVQQSWYPTAVIYISGGEVSGENIQRQCQRIESMNTLHVNEYS